MHQEPVAARAGVAGQVVITGVVRGGGVQGSASHRRQDGFGDKIRQRLVAVIIGVACLIEVGYDRAWLAYHGAE